MQWNWFVRAEGAPVYTCMSETWLSFSTYMYVCACCHWYKQTNVSGWCYVGAWNINHILTCISQKYQSLLLLQAKLLLLIHQLLLRSLHLTNIAYFYLCNCEHTYMYVYVISMTLVLHFQCIELTHLVVILQHARSIRDCGTIDIKFWLWLIHIFIGIHTNGFPVTLKQESLD